MMDLCPRIALTAVAAHVEKKNVKHWAIGNSPVNPAGLRWRIAQRHVFVKGTARSRHKQKCAVYIVFRAIKCFPWRPNVRDLVIVPLGKNRHFGVEGEQIRIKQIVFIISTIVGKRYLPLCSFLQ